VTLALARVGAASAAVPSPPAGKLYHGVYPGHDTDMRVQDNPRLADAFGTLVGAKADVLGRVER
jgi:hypothetical protein